MKGPTKNQTTSPTGWLRMRGLKYKFTEDEKCHNLISPDGRGVVGGGVYQWLRRNHGDQMPKKTQPARIFQSTGSDI